MTPIETLTTTTTTLACDGGGGPLGHPRVFLHVNDEGVVDCPYCGRHYILARDGATTEAADA